MTRVCHKGSVHDCFDAALIVGVINIAVLAYLFRYNGSLQGGAKHA